MLELMQDLYASDVELSIRPSGNMLEIRFFHRKLSIGRTYAMTCVDISEVAMSTDKYVRLLLDGFLKELDDIRDARRKIQHDV